MSEELYKKGGKGFIYEYAGTGIVVFLQLLTSILLIRMLAIHEFGIYNILLSTFSFLMMFTYFTIAPIDRYLPEFFEKKNYFLVKKIVKTSLLIRFGVGITVLLFFYYFPNIFNLVFKDSIDPIFLKIFGFIILVGLLNVTLNAVLTAFLEQKIANIAKTIFHIIFLSLSYITLKSGLGLLGVLYSLLIASTAPFLISFFRVNHLVFAMPDIGAPMKVFRRVARYTFFQYFMKLGDIVLNLTFDIYLIGFFLGMEATALYAFAAKMPSYFIFYGPPAVISFVLFPIVIRKYTETKSKEQLSYLFRVYTRFTVFFVLPVTIGLIILAKPIIAYVFDPRYLPAYMVFIVSTIGFGIWAFKTPISTIYNVLERPEIGLYSKIFVLYNLIADVILIPIYGIMGAIIPTTTTMLFILIFEFYMTRRYIEMSYPWTSFVRTGLNTLFTALILLFIRPLIVNLYLLILAVILGGVVYLIFSFFNKPFLDRDRELFRKTGTLGKIISLF